MESPLLSLPYELRVYIYELMLCNQSTAQLIPLNRPKQRQTIPFGNTEYDLDESYTQDTAPEYPPAEPNPSEVREYELLAQELMSYENDFQHVLAPARDLGEQWTRVNAAVKIGPSLLYDNPDDESETDNIDMDDSEGDFSAGQSTFDPESERTASNLERFGYELTTSTPLDIALLYTCREINTDATPIFYTGANLVFETNVVNAIRFLMTLPRRLLRRVTNITLPLKMLDHYDALIFAGWSSHSKRALNTPSSAYPGMYTPFGAFLTTEMPRLSDVYIYKCKDEDPCWYCLWSLPEMKRLLRHRRIKRSYYMCMGEESKRILESGEGSRKIMLALTGGGVGIQVA